jgi:hypothetical protein
MCTDFKEKLGRLKLCQCAHGHCLVNGYSLNNDHFPTGTIFRPFFKLKLIFEFTF